MKLSNSCIPFKLIEDRCKDYQLFLEKIADFLVDSTFWRENEFSVEFLDVSPVNYEKRLHHFRSRTIKQEMKEVSEIWNTVCIPNYTTLVPALKLYIEQDDGINVIYPGTLIILITVMMLQLIYRICLQFQKLPLRSHPQIKFQVMIIIVVLTLMLICQAMLLLSCSQEH